MIEVPSLSNFWLPLEESLTGKQHFAKLTAPAGSTALVS